MTTMPTPLIASAIRTVESVPMPDLMLRLAVQSLIGTRQRPRQPDPAVDRAFADDMRRRAIAVHTEAANEQHYELPQEFFGLTLGPHRKYSSCYYAAGRIGLRLGITDALHGGPLSGGFHHGRLELR